MAVVARRVTIETGGRVSLTSDDTDASPGQWALIRNAGVSGVDLGGPTVTHGSGFTLAAGASELLTLTRGERIFAAAGSGGATVHVLEGGV